MAGSSTYLTTVKCISASGEVESPELIELFGNGFGLLQNTQ